jgi:hypothetical protein
MTYGIIVSKSRKNEYCIFDCYSKGDAKGVKAIGGFCGANELDNESSDIKSIIENCYSTGKAIGDTLVGGFCGLQSGDGKKEINNSYWDAKTSEIDISDGGEAKTTAEMMMQATFVDWDFDDVWCMGEHETYPQLQYFVDCDTLVSVPTIESNKGLEIYPNPASSHITLSLTDEFISAPQIDIIDYLGNVIRWTQSDRWSTSEKSITINTSSLSPGVYFLRVRSGDKVEVKKFVVLR